MIEYIPFDQSVSGKADCVAEEAPFGYDFVHGNGLVHYLKQTNDDGCQQRLASDVSSSAIRALYLHASSTESPGKQWFLHLSATWARDRLCPAATRDGDFKEIDSGPVPDARMSSWASKMASICERIDSLHHPGC
jgi:hypothetical protein